MQIPNDAVQRMAFSCLQSTQVREAIRIIISAISLMSGVAVCLQLTRNDLKASTVLA